RDLGLEAPRDRGLRALEPFARARGRDLRGTLREPRGVGGLQCGIGAHLLGEEVGLRLARLERELAPGLLRLEQESLAQAEVGSGRDRVAMALDEARDLRGARPLRPLRELLGRLRREERVHAPDEVVALLSRALRRGALAEASVRDHRLADVDAAV